MDNISIGIIGENATVPYVPSGNTGENATAAYIPSGNTGENATVPCVAPSVKTYKPDRTDFFFAIMAFVIGYLFANWVLFSARGWGVTAFTVLYLLSVTIYLVKKEAFKSKLATWFWMAVTLIAGASFTLWENAGVNPQRIMFLFCTATYYIIAASGSAIMGKTGNYLIIDGINAVILIPIRNFINQYLSFGAIKRDGKRRGRALPVILGALVALLLIACLLPMLRRADSGGFGIVVTFIGDLFTVRTDIIVEIFVYLLCAGPIAAYIFGLISGAAHKKGTDTIKPEGAKQAVGAVRFLQPATVYIALGAVCVLYLVFMLSQLPYFFSAFTGERPVGWLVYSEYARQGFFELCGITVINLVLILAGNLTCKKRRVDSRMLKVLNIALALITLALIATAFSKMALYIDAYGLTMPRLLPCVFMLFLGAVFIALIALQKWNFSIVRFALVAGAVLLCGVFMSNPDAMVVRYNTDRYLSGTLSDYDIDILYRARYAGVLPALEVYENSTDEELRTSIAAYLGYLNAYDGNTYREPGRGAHEYSVEMRQALAGIKKASIWGG